MKSNSNLTLYPHQKQALEMTRNHNRCAYYLDMGLGKTFVGSEKMKELNATVNLVVCQKSKVLDWWTHFYNNYDASVYDLTDKEELKDFMEASKMLCDQIVGIINYDLLHRRPELMKLSGFTLMLDESSLIQNPSAKRSKIALKMAAENVILLSGTPTDGKYERLWTQLHLLDWNISKQLYENTYVIWDYIDMLGYFLPVVKGYKNVDRLKQKLKDHGAVFMKTEEVMDLPEQQDIMISVANSSQYKRFMKQGYLEIDNTKLVGDTSLTLRLHARQLCGMYSKEKLAVVKELLESTEDRVIIFYNFTMEFELLKEIADGMKRPYSVVNGQQRDLENYEHESNSITFIQYQAGAMGLNLQKACRIIYFTLPESYGLYEQSKKRIHRIGQKNRCFYYIPLVQGSVEEKILNALKMRKDYSDELFKKDYQIR